MSARELMLGRIRRALGHPTVREAATADIPTLLPLDLVGVMPPMAPGEVLPKFEEELVEVGGCVYRASGLSELEETLRRILASAAAERVILSRNPLLARLGLVEKLRAWGHAVEGWPAARVTSDNEPAALRERVAASFAADVGITGVDFALAETGTLVLSSLTEGTQLASVAPAVHLALYQQEQLVASLEEVLAKLAIAREPGQASLGRSVVFITGTSRTADIEQILIRGVHGPKEVHAILVEEACLGD